MMKTLFSRAETIDPKLRDDNGSNSIYHTLLYTVFKNRGIAKRAELSSL